jgi:hypothetical protein
VPIRLDSRLHLHALHCDALKLQMPSIQDWSYAIGDTP